MENQTENNGSGLRSSTLRWNVFYRVKDIHGADLTSLALLMV